MKTLLETIIETIEEGYSITFDKEFIESIKITIKQKNSYLYGGMIFKENTDDSIGKILPEIPFINKINEMKKNYNCLITDKLSD